MRALLLAAALALTPAMHAAPAHAQNQTPAVEETANLFIVVYSPGPAWRQGLPMSEQGLLPHGRYMRSLLDDGRLVAGGPFASDTGGMMILRAADRAEADAVLAADPAIVSGVFTAVMEHWRPRFRAPGPLPAPPPS